MSLETALLLAVLAGVGAAVAVAMLRLQRAARAMAAQASDLVAALDRLQPGAPARAFYLRAGGQPQGPIELTTLRAMLIDGRLESDALAALAGTDRWQRAADLLAADAGVSRSSPPTA
jgi:hypothetical protein